MTTEEQREQSDLIREISHRSDRYGDKLLEFMDRYGLDNLRDAEIWQLKEYLEALKG